MCERKRSCGAQHHRNRRNSGNSSGDDLHRLIGDAIEASGRGLYNDDVLVVTHKVVSKAEGQLVDLGTITPSDFATRWGEKYNKDPRQVEVVLGEAQRIVRMDRGVLIAETRHGFICANAGVDHSNVGIEIPFASFQPIPIVRRMAYGTRSRRVSASKVARALSFRIHSAGRGELAS